MVVRCVCQASARSGIDDQKTVGLAGRTGGHTAIIFCPMPDRPLWTEIKAYAKRYAESDRRLPLDAECELWLEAIISSRVDSAQTRREAFDFYAGELCAMIREFRDERVKGQARSSTSAHNAVPQTAAYDRYDPQS